MSNHFIGSYAITAQNDTRFRSNHFILTAVNKDFLKKNGIKLSVNKFKTLVRQSKPEFTVLAGNYHIQVRKVNVYDINKFKHFGDEA